LETICEHGCPSLQKDLFNNSAQMSDVNCECLKINIKMAKILMQIMTEQNNQLFNNYIVNKLKNSFEWRR
jgi:hypothetical protein